LAKAKTLITFEESNDTPITSPTQNQSFVYNPGHQNSSNQQQLQLNNNNNNGSSSNSATTNSGVSYQFMKQYFNSNQNEAVFNSYTSEFKKFRDNSIGRYVIQTNKLLITLDKLITFDYDLLYDDSKRECNDDLR
jgi:hypothetical protein